MVPQAVGGQEKIQVQNLTDLNYAFFWAGFGETKRKRTPGRGKVWRPGGLNWKALDEMEQTRFLTWDGESKLELPGVEKRTVEKFV